MARRRRPASRPGYYCPVGSTAAAGVAIADARFKGNVAQYLVDLHDARAVFDFCGGMMFQLDLSPIAVNAIFASGPLGISVFGIAMQKATIRAPAGQLVG